MTSPRCPRCFTVAHTQHSVNTVNPMSRKDRMAGTAGILGSHEPRNRRPYDWLSLNGCDQNTILQIMVGMPAQDRVYDALLLDHFANNRQMAFVSGPRQVGKTTTCRRHADAYCNWDNLDDRELDSRGAGSRCSRPRREPVVRNEPAVPLRRAAQVPALEAVPEGAVRHLRGPAAHHRHREQPPGRLPPRRRQPDGAVLRVSDASVLGRRDRELRAPGSGPDRSSSPLGGFRSSSTRSGRTAATRSRSSSATPASAGAGGRCACGNWSGRTSAT